MNKNVPEKAYPQLKEVLGLAQSSLRIEKKGLYLTDDFERLTQSFWDNSNVARYGNLLSDTAKLSHDIINVSVLCDKIEWIRTIAMEQSWDADRWNLYGTLEIEAFLVQLRSACDHLVPFIQLAVPYEIKKSFEKLLNQYFRGELPELNDFQDTLRASLWFYDVRSIRTEVLHNGANTLILDSPHNGILFKICGLNEKNPYHNPVYLVGSRARFDLFAAFYLAHLIWFRHKLGSFLSKRLSVPLSPTLGLNVRHSPVLKWMSSLETVAEERRTKWELDQ